MGDESDEKEEQQQSWFKVTDRRKFTPQGEIRRETQQEPPQGEAPPKEEKPSGASGEGEASQESPRSDASEPMNFSSFLLSLATTGMVHLGEIPEPTTGQRSENVDAARQMIDILSILKEKTKGNLSAEETHLLDGLLYELRMKFLTKSKVI